jgi:hypothetical protein
MKAFMSLVAAFLQIFQNLCTNVAILDLSSLGSRGSVVVEALRYKPEGRGFMTG